MDHHLTAPQYLVIRTSTEHSLLYSSHSVITSLINAVAKQDEQGADFVHAPLMGLKVDRISRAAFLSPTSFSVG